MGFSIADISVRTRDGLCFTVAEPFSFLRPSGETIMVAAGARCDGASSPRGAWTVVPPFGAYWMAAVLHDAMYRGQTRPIIMDRATADLIFAEAMEALGVPHTTRAALYEAVRMCGESHWVGDRLGEE